MTYRAHMLNRMCTGSACRKADVTSRYTSPSRAMPTGHSTNCWYTAGIAFCNTNITTLAAISTSVTHRLAWDGGVWAGVGCGGGGGGGWWCFPAPFGAPLLAAFHALVADRRGPH